MKQTPSTAEPLSSIALAGKPIAHRVESNVGLIAIVLAQSLTLGPRQILEVRV